MIFPPKDADRPPLATDPCGEWLSPEGPFWMSRSPVQPGWWRTVHAQHADSGLWPVFLDGLPCGSSSQDELLRPWQSGELEPEKAAGDPGSHDPAVLLRDWFAVLRHNWIEQCEPEEWHDVFQPFTDGWPGLAPPGTGTTDPDADAAEVAELLVDFDRVTDARLGLVRAPRSADVPTVLGWGGPLNHEPDTSRISAVLRSWEDRFGARLVALGFDTMILSVYPLEDEAAALRVAAEHLAFCPDNIAQGAGTLARYATSLVGVSQWEFWWD